MKKVKVIKVKVQKDYKLVVPHKEKKRTYLSDKVKEVFWNSFSKSELIEELVSGDNPDDYDTYADYEKDMHRYDDYSYKDLVWECFDVFILYKDSSEDFVYERRKGL